MSTRSYYRWALVLPLALPLLSTGLMLLDGMPSLVNAVNLYLYWSLLLGGIPYVLFATGFLLWSRGRSDAQVRRGILLAPLVFTPWLVVCLGLFLTVDSGLSSGTELMGALAGYGLGFGYVYVGLAELGRLLLRPGQSPLSPAVPA
jgi:hypothetical protein